MRFRKGSKVEVFSNDGAPYGAWRCAEIISGNGHTYGVRLDSSQSAKDRGVMERVLRRNIRPRPPQQMNVDRWESGELVEVRDDLSWKIATVLRASWGNYYVVRLLGASAEFEVHKVNIRVRQFWLDERWNQFGKVSGSLKSSTLTGSDHPKPQTLLNDPLPREPSVASSRMLKRVSPSSWPECAESCTGNPWKLRSIEIGGQQHHYRCSLLQKVDDVACEPENLGKIHSQGSFKYHKNGCCEMVRVRSNGFNELAHAGTTEASAYDSDASSTGSCSAGSYDKSNMSAYMLDGASQDADSASSDTESSCGRGEGQNSLAEDVEAAHRNSVGDPVDLASRGPTLMLGLTAFHFPI
ncbi:PREDICTED: uncharacterized protein LOC104803830 isoform X2 [Tarenaya hassleriana]|uniref:uncharacterized protein LOC104803830 isoform X2 n=1 Tax=Tarenaya hassleriana TaxID=28532 RepID=UPI00053C83DF|nr:PREDICTED: uncharacterized protein LOC104803830 isoform X2 [Tarenaya hassleriana]